MFCKNCGSEIQEGSKFCVTCGQKVDDTTESIQQTVSKPVAQPVAQSASQSAGNRKLIIVIIAIAAVFLIVAIIFGVLVLNKLGDNDSDDDKKDIKTEEAIDEDISDASVEDVDVEDAEDVEDDSDETNDEGDAAGSDDLKAYIAERFPKLTEGYAQPKSDNTFWIPIDDATRAKLDALDNDYNKIAWVVEYAFRQLPDVVVSFTINNDSGVPYVFLAFTNVGEAPVSIDGTADIYDFDNQLLNSGYPYIGMLQPGGTYMCPIACPGVDENNVDIGFTELNMDYPAAKPGTYSYEASLGASTNNSITTSISVTNTGDKMVNMGQVTVLLLDEKGFPVGNGYVFSATSTNPGEKMESDVVINILGEDIEKIKDIVVYASPYITG